MVCIDMGWIMDYREVIKNQAIFMKCSQYYTFLETFGESHSFQTFSDKQGAKKSLIKQFHGTIRQHFHELAELNRKGAGVFFTVNQTDLLGRTTRHINQVRAVFIDLDGTPLPAKFDLQPHLIVNTSPKKYHCYWLVSDMPLESFTLYQQALAEKFDADPKVKDLPRVMRVAGFYHNKNKPFPIKIIKKLERNPYSREQLKVQLGLRRPKTHKIVLDKTYKHTTTNFSYGAGEGDRHEKLIKMLISIRMRGESYDYAREEAIRFAQACEPPENLREVIFQLNDIWRRYVPTA